MILMGGAEEHVEEYTEKESVEGGPGPPPPTPPHGIAATVSLHLQATAAFCERVLHGCAFAARGVQLLDVSHHVGEGQSRSCGGWPFSVRTCRQLVRKI